MDKLMTTLCNLRIVFFFSPLSCIFKWAAFELGGCWHCRSALIQTTNLICWLCASFCNLNLSLLTRMNLLSKYLYFCIMIWVSWLICSDTDLEGMSNLQQHQHKFGIQMAMNYLLWKIKEETTTKKIQWGMVELFWQFQSPERITAMKGKADNN